MVTDNNTGPVISINNKVSGSEKVQAIQPEKPLQTLPEDGKYSPPNKEKLVLQAEELNEVVRGLNERVQSVQRELQFSVDKDSGHVVIKVFDTESQELIRQIPSEEALRFARMLSEGDDLELFDDYI